VQGGQEEWLATSPPPHRVYFYPPLALFHGWLFSRAQVM